MTQGYMRYPPAGRCYGTLSAQVSEPIPAGTVPIRVRNGYGTAITILGVQGFATALTAGGCTLDLQNAATASHLAAPIALVAGARASTTTITGAAGTTIAAGVDAYFIFISAGGGATNDAQAILTYTVQMLSL